MLPLFDKPEIAGVPREDYAARLQRLATDNIYIGTSSWKYPGWLGSIYTDDRYRGRRGFSKKRFEQECLAEYAEVFPTVCGDFSFYRFYETPFWDRLISQVPANFQFGLKVPQDITTRVWPKLDRHGALAGARNSSFLDVARFQAQFTDVLRPYRDRLGPLIFEFGELSKESDPNGARDFVEDLGPFLAKLPTGFRYAVEVRNREFLEPRYFECLRAHNVAHVFNSWTRMPGLAEQLDIPDAVTADFLVSRALLRPGRGYKQAVQSFQPYESIQDPYPEGRASLERLVTEARRDQRPAYLYVNNRLEGNAPATIEAFT